MKTLSAPLRLALLVVCLLAAVPALADVKDVPTVWRLLDYIAVDYREAVRDGAIVSESEYKEMVEFSATAREKIEALPATAALGSLTEQAVGLERAIAAREAPETIARLARGLAADLIRAYPVPAAPAAVPDLQRGKAVYAEHCASCHGVTGGGDGPATVGVKLDPPPIAFTDEERARERSLFALHQVIEQGLDGTSMASFAEVLSPQDRWAVAAYAGSLAYPAADVTKGEALWKADTALRGAMTLERLVALRPAELAEGRQEADAKALAAFLRHRPEAAIAPQPSGAGRLTLARTRLDEALAAYRRGDRKQATDLALSAYLDGFEPLEPALAARDKPLMIRIEEAMIGLRAAMAKGAPVEEVAAAVKAVDDLFGQAETALGEGSSSTLSTFLAAFTILLREGLEALLIVVAMMAFLRKAERPELLPWIHGGWIGALAAGAATWAVATWLVEISGANRELTEGFGSLLAAIVLVWVGIWMHGKSHANAWQTYVRERMDRALSGRSGWLLLGLAFVVVYREVFETILFYAAIWNQGDGSAVLGGAGAAILVLAVVAWLMLRYSRRLPVGQFFRYSSILMAVLAVVLIGKAVSALQEAGYLPVNPLAFVPRLELLGLYPTQEGVMAQVLVAFVLLGGFGYNAWAEKRAA